MGDRQRFGDPAKLALGIRRVDDPDPPDQRPAGYGWSMGHLTIRAAGRNVTATTCGGEQQPRTSGVSRPGSSHYDARTGSITVAEEVP